MNARCTLLAAAMAASCSSLAAAQDLSNVQRPTGSVSGVVQAQGSQRPVTDVNINQNSQNNMAGVMQAGGNPSASVNQSGQSNFGMVNQTGDSTRASINQTGRTNDAMVGQSGNRNTSSINQRER